MKHLICTHIGNWVCNNTNGDVSMGLGPEEGEIVDVKEEITMQGHTYFMLVGYETNPFTGFPSYFNERHFKACDDSFGEWVESTVMKELELEMMEA